MLSEYRDAIQGDTIFWNYTYRIAENDMIINLSILTMSTTPKIGIGRPDLLQLSQ